MATILIVDDRAPNREYLVEVLGCAGYRLLEAADGAEALAIARSEHPDLIIADILMPKMDGYELVRQLRMDPEIGRTPVIFCTAHYNEREVQPLAWLSGVSDVITKPSAPARIVSAVETVLGIGAPATLTTATVPLPDTRTFDREHVRLLTDKLSQKADELNAAKEMLSAALNMGLQLGSESDLRFLLKSFRDAVEGRVPPDISEVLGELYWKRKQVVAAISSLERMAKPVARRRRRRPVRPAGLQLEQTDGSAARASSAQRSRSHLQ
ncbi:MAG: response regulator [Bryobacteraceae bacterium]